MPDAAAQVIRFYENHASDFDAERNRDLFEKAWLDRFLSFIPSGGHILDLGCGTGQPLAAYMIEQGYHITGVDAVREMIDLCQSRFPAHTWLTCDMRELDLARKFDGLLAWDSFFHLPHDDQKKMFSIFQQHTRKDAPLMFTAGPDHGEVTNPLWGDPLYHASFSADEYADLMQQHKFESVAADIADKSCCNRTI